MKWFVILLDRQRKSDTDSPVTDNILSCVRSDEKYLCGDGPGKKVKKLEDIYSY